MEGLHRFISDQMARFGVPGAAVGLVRGGDVLFADGIGVRDTSSGAPVTPRTVFAIGSSTKAFTAALCGALVDDGLLDWDTPIREYLPWFRMHDPVATELVTVRDVLSHRTGLPRHDLLWYGDPPISRGEMVARIRHLPPNKGFREAWQYNNLGYLTAGYLAGELLGISWEDAVRKRILEPLGMTATNFSVSDSRHAPDHSLPHDEREDRVVPIPFRTIDTVGPAGCINASLEDMLSFVRTVVEGGVLGERRVFSEATVREMHRPQMLMNVPSLFPENREDAYGLGWFISTYRGHRVVHHGGNIDGFTALMTILPEARAGLVVLTNRQATLLPKLISFHVWDLLLGLEPIDWPERFAGALDAMKHGQREARARAAARYASDRGPSHPLADYVGDYHHPGYGTIGIRLSDDGTALVPSYNGLDLALRHRHYDVFELRLAGRDEMRAPIVFVTDPEGEIASASVQVEGAVSPLPFSKQPDPILRDPAFLARMTGTYEMGDVTATLELRGDDRLVLTMPMVAPGELEPTPGMRFRMKHMPALSIGFAIRDDGVVSELEITGVGTFTRRA